MQNHPAEVVGLAGFVMLGPILNELESISPGAKARILATAKASLVHVIHNQPGGEAAAILAVLDEMDADQRR